MMWRRREEGKGGGRGRSLCITLDHEVLDDAVEAAALVVQRLARRRGLRRVPLAQRQKVGHRLRRKTKKGRNEASQGGLSGVHEASERGR